VTVVDRVNEVGLPKQGVWRIGRASDPYETRPPLGPDELNTPKAGNRFDSPLGTYSVLYFGTSLEACFGETLSRFRPDPALAAELEGEWSAGGWLKPGEVPASWRHRRLAVRVKTAEPLPFLDVEALRTRETLAKVLSPSLSVLGVSDLDVAVIRGGDRRITRFVSLWAWSQTKNDGSERYAGLRYLSRLNTAWECWAFFDRTATEELERRAITREDPALQEVAADFDLRVF
jgi:hypothetical protein